MDYNITRFRDKQPGNKQQYTYTKPVVSETLLSLNQFKGMVTKVIFKGDNDYNVCQVKVNREKITLTITHPDIKVGFEGNFVGNWVDNDKYGKQFKCDFLNEALPESSEGFLLYLVENVKGIGPKKASIILDHLGSKPVQKLHENADAILGVPGIKKEILEQIKEDWLGNSVYLQTQVFLGQYGIVGKSLRKIIDCFGDNTITTIRKNPYVIIENIHGIGFSLADKLALNLGIAKDSDLRITESIKHILNNNTRHGSCYLIEEDVITNVANLIGFLKTDKIKEILNNSAEIVRLDLNDSLRYYSKRLYHHEQTVLKIIQEKMDITTNRIDVKKIDPTNQLSPEQKKAVITSLTSTVSILTGGAGVGKTFTTKFIVDKLHEEYLNFAICAPTGKAAMRSTEVIGYPASTIHRLLMVDPVTGGFKHNAVHPLDLDYLIVEESSMIDISLMSALLSATPTDCQVLFVGDHNQLPPVGPGAPFKDMIESGKVKVSRLTKIFRQAKNSAIIKYGYDMNNNCFKNNIPNPMRTPELWKSKQDCLFMDSVGVVTRPRNEYPKFTTQSYGMDAIQTTIRLYTKTIKESRGIIQPQILIPKRVGNLGTVKVNELIQAEVNPLTTENPNEIISNKTSFRLGDKVIHVRNNYQLGEYGVFNGEIGIIESLDSKKRTCVVKFFDKSVRYSFKDMRDLELAYAITIHKSQGSEFEAVILLVLQQFSIMLERQLLYTGITRAKDLCVIIGERQWFTIGVNNINNKKRKTSLSELLNVEA